MPVQENCVVNNLIIKINITAGQRLRYTVREDTGVQFQLRDESGKILLSNAAASGDQVKVWPESAAENPGSNDVSHGLGIAFGQAAQLRWIIELLAADRSVLVTVKDCVYANTETNPNPFFDTIRIRSA